MRTKFPNKDILPRVLHRGDRLVSPLGRTIIIQARDGINKYDQPTYRLKYPKSKVERKTRKGMEGEDKEYWIMPASTSSKLYSRDDLHEMGIRLFVEG